MIKKLQIILFTSFLLIAVGCTIQNTKIRYIAFKVYDPVYIAQEKGFFDKHNVEVEILDTVSAGPNAIQSVASGSSEACLSSLMATIKAVDKGLDVVAVSDIQSSIKDQALEEFFVRKESEIKNISDLRGKKIAINIAKSSFHYTWLMALEQNGLSETDVEFIILPFEQQELALENKQVDAIGLMQPYILKAKENSNFKLLFTANDVFGDKQFSTHVLNSKWAGKNSEKAAGFVTAIAEAEQWIENNQEEAKVIVSKYTGVDVKYIEDYYFQENGQVIINDVNYWIDYLKSRNELSNQELAASDLATNNYNKLVK